MKLQAALLSLAAAALFVPIPPRYIERFYSHGLFPIIQPSLTALSNRSPVAFFDVLLIAVMGLWLLLVVRDFAWRTGGWLRATGRTLWRTAVWGSALYLAFLFAWGLNYRRVPLIERLPFDPGAVTPEAARSLALTSIDELNRLHDPAHAIGWVPAGAIDTTLSGALARADFEAGGPGVVLAARPKTTLLNWYFRRAAVDGMTDPYFLETLVSSDLLPFERPFVLAHEWSHLTGLADEGDANFLGWLACVQAAAPQQYSGWLFLYTEVSATFAGRDRADLAGRLGPGPRADLTAIRDRLAREVSPRVAAAGWRMYDQYLKANRVPAGAASYAQVVRLVLGTRFAPGWAIER
jgi:Protein of unknown function (DUF3810)